jgi:hypothetical protein
LNDLWSYNYLNSKWTWLSGVQETNVARDVNSNIPGGRHSASGWIDPFDLSLFLFGGRLGGTIVGADLWKWKDNSWIYLGGNLNQESIGTNLLKNTLALLQSHYNN